MKSLLLMFLFIAPPLAAQDLSVVHVRDFRRDVRGTIRITDTGIVYKAEKPKDSRSWLYQDIQHFDRISEKEFSILSYENQRLLLGRDREYRFRITGGRLTDELFQKIESRLYRPVTNRVVGKIRNPEYTLPVKHLHTFGGCAGTLEFTKDAIYYQTKDKKDARDWRLGEEVQSVWSADPYQLEITAYDNNRREFSQTRLYRFELKKPLDPTFYRKLKLRLYDLEKAHRPD
jgi:hypothetical protein